MRKFVSPIAIAILCLLITTLWFRKGLMFAGGEEGIPFYNLEKTFKLSAFTWRDYSAGYPNLAELTRFPNYWLLEAVSKLSVPTLAIQAAVFFLLMAIGTISVYFFFKEILSEDLGNKLKKKGLNNAPFVAAAFYLLNPYSMTQVWGRGLYMQFFAFALIPSFLLLFMIGLKKRKLAFAIAAILVSFVFSPTFTNPSLVYALWTPVFIYLAYYLIHFRKDKSRVVFAVVFIVFLLSLWLLSNMWWIAPFVKFGNSAFANFLYDPGANLGTLMGVSRQFPLPILIRLIHKGSFFEARYYGEIYLNPLFILLSWLPPIISLFSFTIIKKSKHFFFFVSLFLISLFISLGANFPTGRFFIWLFKNITYFQALRNPYEKFGLVLALAYVPFFSLGLVGVSREVYTFLKTRAFLAKKINPNLIAWFILILVCFVYVWPMWTGHFAGGFKINPWIKVPDYYRQADGWIKTQNPNGRIIQLPINPGDGVIYEWEHPYRGIEPSDFLFSNTSIGRNISFDKIYYNVLLERFGKLQKNVFGPDPDISKSDFRSQDFYEELAKLNVRYIVLHNDIDWRSLGLASPEETEDYLAGQPNINKEKTFGLLDIYKVNIAEKINQVYSPDTKTSFVKVNPTFYKVKVENAKDPIDLYLLELFDDNWEAFIDGKKVENHTRAFSYANAWRIDKNGSFEVLIKYAPQDIVILGTKITKITLLFVFTLLAVQLLRKEGKANIKTLIRQK